MRKELKIKLTNTSEFKIKLLIYGNKLDRFVLLDSNNFIPKNTQYTYYQYDFLAALGSAQEISAGENSGFEKFKQFNNENPDWRFGYLTYDLKNDTENLTSGNIDELNLAALHFFVPEIVLTVKKGWLTCSYLESKNTEMEMANFIDDVNNTELPDTKKHNTSLQFKQRFEKPDYIKTVNKLKEHIQLGDIYEINFCQEFYDYAEINPVKTALLLREISPTPFACYYKLDNNFLLSASPERFLKKINNKVISQPIKGTVRRNTDQTKDEELKVQLHNDPKERAENVMIVDLVRNDLSRTAKRGTVKVEELYGIYSFSQVHQMISTVVSEVDPKTDITDIIKNAYPMGSMTGAPKVRAMQLIEKYEKSKRGLYSGTVGYITPNNDFDFNVVIRSILYNQLKNYVSFTVGGAITSLSDPDKEYEECMVKAEAMLKAFS